MKSIYVILNISRKGIVYWGVIWCFLIEILYCKCYAYKNVFYELKLLGLTSLMSVIFNLYFFGHSSIYLVPDIMQKRVVDSLFKNQIHLQENKDRFFTYLPFCLLSTRKISFYLILSHFVIKGEDSTCVFSYF